MQNFQDSFETRKQSFISACSICMTVPLRDSVSLETFKHKIKEPAKLRTLRTLAPTRLTHH